MPTERLQAVKVVIIILPSFFLPNYIPTCSLFDVHLTITEINLEIYAEKKDYFFLGKKNLMPFHSKATLAHFLLDQPSFLSINFYMFCLRCMINKGPKLDQFIYPNNPIKNSGESNCW